MAKTSVMVHFDGDVAAESKVYDGSTSKPFATLSISSASNDVTFFVHDIVDAVAIYKAAKQLIADVAQVESVKANAEAIDSVTL